MDDLDIAEAVKQHLGIATPNDEMNDAEIAAVCRCIGIRYNGIHDMIFTCLMDWPEFYEKYGLWHNN